MFLKRTCSWDLPGVLLLKSVGSQVSSLEVLIPEVWVGAQECVLLKAPGEVLQSGKFGKNTDLVLEFKISGWPTFLCVINPGIFSLGLNLLSCRNNSKPKPKPKDWFYSINHVKRGTSCSLPIPRASPGAWHRAAS